MHTFSSTIQNIRSMNHTAIMILEPKFRFWDEMDWPLLYHECCGFFGYALAEPITAGSSATVECVMSSNRLYGFLIH
jgi:hypothetical protein